jgi:hypothetical protein
MCYSALYYCNKITETKKGKRFFLAYSFGSFSAWLDRHFAYGPVIISKSWRKHMLEEPAHLMAAKKHKEKERSAVPKSPFLKPDHTSYWFHHVLLLWWAWIQVFNTWVFGKHLRYKL